MTEKLYYLDAYKAEFQCKLVSFKEDGDSIIIETDKTAFFPEGGGQTSDRGYLEGMYIYDVQTENDIIYHYTQNTPEALEILKSKLNLKGEIDMGKRFSDMQQHSGEHIFSGLTNRLYGYNNVGFHLGSEVVTLDFDGVLTEEDIYKLEKLANKAVWDNKEIIVSYPSKNKLKEISYRSKIEIDGQTRLITIPGIDVCACCAPHVKATGEIGIIEVVSFEKYKGGTRLSILCGERALYDIRHKLNENHKISVLTSSKQNETSLFVEKLKKDKEKADYEIYGLKKELLSLKVNLIKDEKRIVIFDNSLEGKLLQDFALLLKEKAKDFAAVFCGSDNNYRYVIISPSTDLRKIGKELNQKFTGKGGGRPEMLQGTLIGTENEIKNFLFEYEGETL